MKNSDIFKAMTDIDEKLIEESAPYKKSTITFKKLIPIAACICIVIAISAGFLSERFNRLTPHTQLPDIVFDSMGYEGINSLDLQNSIDINPYTKEAMPDTLPVFKNLCYSGGLYQNFFSEENLQKSITELAEKLGKNSLEFSTLKGVIDTDDPNYEEDLIYNVIAESDELCISANGYRFSISPKTKEASDKLLAYLKENYDMQNIGEHKEFSVDGELLTTKYKAYKKGTSVKENILSFNLLSAEIHYTDTGLIDFVILNDYLNSSEKIADYKTIPIEKATAKLLLGTDVDTSTPAELIIGGKVQKEHIIKADLIYYANNLQQVFVPSYRFYVKLINPDPNSEIENYGLFYVPAVELTEASDFEAMRNVFQ